MMMQIFFDILFGVYIVLYFPILLLRGKWHGGFRERFGFFSPELQARLSAGENIWVHAVSVGEVMAIDGLIRRLQGAYPGKRIVLSVTTKTGYALAEKKYARDLVLLWAPLDLSWSVASFIKVIRPVCYIAAETELWPNLFAALHQKGIPLLVVNGRISDAAFPRYQWVRGLLKGTLERVNVFCMQSERDAERIKALGAPAYRVKMVGNIKFDNTPLAASTARLEDFGFSAGDLVLVGGSTHPGEEEILVDVFKSVQEAYPRLRLVLAPRHPERSFAVADVLQGQGLKAVFFSAKRARMAPDEVLVVDTIGHLLGLYSVAAVVFVGKSLTVKGGHNVIEPALFAKPVIVGPYMQNFRDITQIFNSQNALIQVADAQALRNAVERLLQSPQERMEMGQRALAVVKGNTGATQKTVDEMRGILR